jgi:hypothetical protein
MSEKVSVDVGLNSYTAELIDILAKALPNYDSLSTEEQLQYMIAMMSLGALAITVACGKQELHNVTSEIDDWIEDTSL